MMRTALRDCMVVTSQCFVDNILMSTSSSKSHHSHSRRGPLVVVDGDGLSPLVSQFAQHCDYSTALPYHSSLGTSAATMSWVEACRRRLLEVLPPTALLCGSIADVRFRLAWYVWLGEWVGRCSVGRWAETRGCGC